jgi:hypothetical protein
MLYRQQKNHILKSLIVLDNTIVKHYDVINDTHMGKLRNRTNLEWTFCAKIPE